MDLMLVGIVDNQEIRFPVVEGTLLVGRSEEAAIRLGKSQVSRRHAEIIVTGDQILVRDLGSHNGTLVNGVKVEDTATLSPGDRFEVADLCFRLEHATVVGAKSRPVTMLGHTVKPNVEISWDEVNTQQGEQRDLQSLLFRVLAKAGDLLTIPRAPEELYEPILDLVETALLKPERIFVLLLEGDAGEPVQTASRFLRRGNDALVLSKTMITQVLKEKKSFLTSDALNDPGFGGMMSMVSQGIRSAIAVPLFDNEDVIGILYADDSRPDRFFTRDQLAAFTLLANTIAVALTHARYHHLKEEKARQDAELATASEILDQMLPSALPALEGYDVLASLEPCYEVGGDLYDAQLLDDGRYAFLIGDVTGKGLGAALLVSNILSLTRFMLSEGWEPQALVTRLNQQIFKCTDHIRFATFFLGFLDPASGRFSFVNAGHNPPYLVRADGSVEECPPSGLPVGMLDDSNYRLGEAILEKGDLLALYSDGIPETQRLDDEEYGEENFQKLLVREGKGDLQKLFELLQGELAEFRGQAPIGDDVTLVTLRRN